MQSQMNFARKKRSLFFSSLLLTSLGLAGCSSTVPLTQYYQLQMATENANTAPTPITRAIVIGQVKIAPFLAQDGIVYQLNDVEYRAANQHVWITPLENQWQMKLKSDLTALLPNATVLSQPIETWKTQINVEVSEFQGTEAGDVKVSGRWILKARNGTSTILPFACKKALPADGYEVLVQTLSQCVYEEEQKLVSYL